MHIFCCSWLILLQNYQIIGKRLKKIIIIEKPTCYICFQIAKHVRWWTLQQVHLCNRTHVIQMLVAELQLFFFALLYKILLRLTLNERSPLWCSADSSDKSLHQTFKPGGTCAAVSPCPCFVCKQISYTSCRFFLHKLLLTNANSVTWSQYLKSSVTATSVRVRVKLWETVLSGMTFHFQELSF